MPRIAGPLTISMFLGSFAWSFAFISLPFYIQSISPYDPATTLRWAGWILGVSSLVTVLTSPAWGRVGERGNPRTQYLLVQVFQGRGVHGDGDRPHAPAAPRRPAHPGRDGRGVDARVHHREPAVRSRGGAPRGGGGAARDDHGAGAGPAGRRDGRGARRVPAVVRARRRHPARVGGLRALGRAPPVAPGAPASPAGAGAGARPRHAGGARPGGVEPALLPDGGAARGPARPGRGARARGGGRRPPGLRLGRGRRPGGARDAASRRRCCRRGR